MVSKVYKISGIVVIILSIILGLLLFRTDLSVRAASQLLSDYDIKPVVYNWETLVKIAGVGSVLGLILIGIGDLLDVLRLSYSRNQHLCSNNITDTVNHSVIPEQPNNQVSNQEKTIQSDSSFSWKAPQNH